MVDYLRYTCCVVVEGNISGPQEAPMLYCPNCGDKMTVMRKQDTRYA